MALCRSCSSINIDAFHNFLRTAIPWHRTTSDLVASADSCALCSLFVSESKQDLSKITKPLYLLADYDPRFINESFPYKDVSLSPKNQWLTRTIGRIDLLTGRDEELAYSSESLPLSEEVKCRRLQFSSNHHKYNCLATLEAICSPGKPRADTRQLSKPTSAKLTDSRCAGRYKI
jgi:hypothetical protein